MKLFDANTWIGRWPFTFQPAFSAKTLAAHLRRHGIADALVSPVDAVFAPEPGPANRALLRDTRRVTGLHPVPVINPALGNWRERVADVAADPRVRAVRLLPAYHGYGLNSAAVDSLLPELARRGLRLVVTIRLIDERHEHHAVAIRPVPVAELTQFLERHPRLLLLASGLGRPDVLALLPRFRQLQADASFIEWFDTTDYLLAKVAAEQLVFASHTPFLITAAAGAKLESARAPARLKAKIAAANLKSFLTP
ncbi:hypothetical protein [Opitutus sp. ER46]|uniref:amidohydrolase family protein n=1 Tax=Opitutus sp. ER46 TaxID=2161864 RepID=UPI000D322CD0|nr:hypothetical protein [Opitutus sp. ER46]PTX94489.1 hypothetical protein DB354_12150 [Opitutus sp. ER46]